MDRLERFRSPEESLIKAMTGWQAGVWTAIPGVVESFDPVKQTLTIQPTIKARFENPETQEKRWIQLPLLVDVILVTIGGGGMSLTNPIAKGDEALVVFSSRCIDAWWQSGGIQNQPELRMHDLSDGFAIVGLRSLPRAIQNYSATETQVRSDDGLVCIGVNPTAHTIHLKATTVTIDAALVVNGKTDITGNVDIDGYLKTVGDLKNNGKDVGSTHKHSGVQSGSSNTGNPI